MSAKNAHLAIALEIRKRNQRNIPTKRTVSSEEPAIETKPSMDSRDLVAAIRSKKAQANQPQEDTLDDNDELDLSDEAESEPEIDPAMKRKETLKRIISGLHRK